MLKLKQRGENRASQKVRVFLLSLIFLCHNKDAGYNSTNMKTLDNIDLRWLDWIFWGWYLPTFSINYVGMSKDMEKKLPQLYYIKMKISYDLGFITIGVAMAT